MSLTDATAGPSRLLWTSAAVAALAFHLGCVAVAASFWLPAEPDDGLGSPGIAISLDLAAPRNAPTDLPPGPEQDDSAASPAIAEQKAVVKDSELPKDKPVETETPDRLVTQNNEKKPQEEDPKPAETPVAPSEESVAAQATAMPNVQAAQEAERSTTTEQGIGETKSRLRATWQRELVSYFDKHKRYPANRTQQGAEILVSFVLDRVGHVVSASVVKGSGDQAFDEAAIAMIRRSDPVPAPPPLVADDGLSFTLPVIFRTKAKN